MYDNDDEVPALKCKKCGKVHFAVSLSFVKSEIKNFSEYFNLLPLKDRIELYGNARLNIVEFLLCNGCGNSYLEFEDTDNIIVSEGRDAAPLLHYSTILTYDEIKNILDEEVK